MYFKLRVKLSSRMLRTCNCLALFSDAVTSPKPVLNKDHDFDVAQDLYTVGTQQFQWHGFNRRQLRVLPSFCSFDSLETTRSVGTGSFVMNIPGYSLFSSDSRPTTYVIILGGLTSRDDLGTTRLPEILISDSASSFTSPVKEDSGSIRPE